jgi:hypothetical protein
MILDPKLLSKIVHSQLIQAAMLIGVKKADDMKKDILIPVFIKAVEAVPEAEQENLDDKVVAQYNHIVTTFGLDKEPEAAPTTAQEEPPTIPDETAGTEGEPAQEVSKVAEATSGEETSQVPVSTEVPPQPKNSTEKEVKTTMPKETKKATPAKKEGYSRIQAFADAIKSKKSGTVDSLITLANQKYVAKGGKDNVKEASTVVNMGLKVLVGMGTVSLDGDKFKII